MAVVKDPATGQKMTLAHWWFFPASYDVWMLSKEVAGDAAAEPRQAGPASEDGKWVVASRFVRDVARFNEWGNEADYVIADYHAKVALYKGSKVEPAKSKKKSSSLTGGKKGSKSKSSDVASASSDFSGAPNAGSSKAGENDRKRDRRAGSGMNPRPILTGFYSESGSRIRRIVHDGALRVPVRAVGIVRDSLDLVSAGWDEEELKKWEASGGNKGKRRVFELPSVDSVARPSLDSSLGPTFLVTELFSGSGGKSVVRNRRVAVLPNPDDFDNGPDRIRGGGGEGEGEGNDEDIDMTNASAVITGTEPTEADLCVGSNLPEAATPVPGVEATMPYNTAGSGPADSAVPEEEAPQIAPMDASSGTTPSALGGTVVQSAPSESAAVERLSSQIPEVYPPAAPSVQDSLVVSRTPLDDCAGTASKDPAAAPVPAQIPGSQLSPQTGEVPPPRSSEGPVTEPVVLEKDTAVTLESDSEAGQSAGVNSSGPTQKPSVPATATSPTLSASVSETGGAARQVATLSSSSPPGGASEAPVPPASLSSGSVKTDTAPASSPPSAPTPTPSTTTTAPTVTALPDRSAQPSSATSAEADDTPMSDSSAPSWYDPRAISDMERTLLPEWFDSSSIHRTPDSYMEARERIIRIGRRSQGRYITATAVRRVVPGDAGSLLRLHAFLINWGFLNGDAMGDSAPTLPGLRKQEEKTLQKPQRPRLPDGKFSWTGKMRNSLAIAVVKFATKQQKSAEVTTPMGSRVDVDWVAVAAEVGNGATPADCQGEFLSLSLDHSEDDVPMDEVDVTGHDSDDATGRRKRRRVVGRREVLNELLDGVRPSVIAEATNAALSAAGGDIVEAQKAAVLGVLGAQATKNAKNEEDAIERILMEMLDQRMMRLENRVALLDDMEGMLEAERVALELERRDLYTARCRHWFGGGN
uniref:SWIRM domain-containing protein n=1 Tax=Pseudictyota dubia TaxID=2749911 RepID=A0A7R9ZGQ5_9STRA